MKISTKRVVHTLRVKLAKVKWYFDLLHFAMYHSKQVDDYKFLVEIRNAAHERYLEVERIDNNDPDVEKLKTQIELIDKILGYVKPE